MPRSTPSRAAARPVREDESSRTVRRTLDLLERLSVSVEPLGNEQLARSLGVPTSSMHRLLQKLTTLGYVQFDPVGRWYSIGPRLGELAERLSDASCRSLPMRQMLTSIRRETGHAVAVWVPSGVHVRIAALVHGDRRGPSSNSLGELSYPFSTPGLAIALGSPESAIRQLARQCRVRGLRLGYSVATVTDVLRVLRLRRPAGYVTGYNLRADGWGVVAWPIPITEDPKRIASLAIGAPVQALRRQEAELTRIVQRERAQYLQALRTTTDD